MRDFAGQSLTWVRSTGHGFDLRAPDNSVIATFPLEALGSRNVGIAGIRFHRAKALVCLPDGTGRTGIGILLLNEEDGDIVIYTGTQGHIPNGDFSGTSRLAIYKESLKIRESRLEFDDGTTFRWDRLGKSGTAQWVDEAGTAYVVIDDEPRRDTDKFRVDILPSAARIADAALSLLLVLGIYNMDVENLTRYFEGSEVTKIIEYQEDWKRALRWLRNKLHG